MVDKYTSLLKLYQCNTHLDVPFNSLKNNPTIDLQMVVPFTEYLEFEAFSNEQVFLSVVDETNHNLTWLNKDILQC